MKILIKYPTTERQYVSKHTYQHVMKEIELEPIRIIRSPCGTGAAANRYYYQADFKAPRDAASNHNGIIRANIARKKNPSFSPRKLAWTGNVAVILQQAGGCDE